MEVHILESGEKLREELGLITTEKTIRRAVQRITELRRSLLRAKRYYDHLGLAINRLAENELGQIPAPALDRLGILQRRAAYLRQAILEQRECVTQVREAYQAKVDMEQNQVMKLLTVLTAILLCKSIAKWPCAAESGTALESGRVGRDGPHARKISCASLFPIFLVRCLRMKFHASDPYYRVVWYEFHRHAGTGLAPWVHLCHCTECCGMRPELSYP